MCVCVLHCTNPQSVQEGNATTTTCLILILLLFSQRMWGQHGGHMSVIETTPCGVIWAISFDQTLWVYNGGYGSALTRGKLGTCVHAICRKTRGKLGTCVHAICRKGHREVGRGLGWVGGRREGGVCELLENRLLVISGAALMKSHPDERLPLFLETCPFIFLWRCWSPFDKR